MRTISPSSSTTHTSREIRQSLRASALSAGDLMSNLLEITGLTKSFGGTVVLNNVDLSVGAGEVRALLGENGAGKSTLIKILAGIHHEESGTFAIDGVKQTFRNPHDSALAGVATVHQELMISPGLSVAENVLLGTKMPTRLGKIAWGELNRTAEKWFAELGQKIDVSRPVDELSAVQMTMTAIARALCLDAKILILDEPTAALTDSEVHL
ncbi:MAG: ATP-binding cassette domain-containing protein, partial [Actinobacteria bacterium]|nr:ATP-binding cassette domain-containing protein [Actinomycetota bacterium]